MSTPLHFEMHISNRILQVSAAYSMSLQQVKHDSLIIQMMIQHAFKRSSLDQLLGWSGDQNPQFQTTKRWIFIIASKDDKLTAVNPLSHSFQ